MSGRENCARYLVFLLVFVAVGCQRAPSDFTTANKEIVRQWFSALDAQDFDALTDLMDEQFVVPARIIDGPNRAVGRNATFEVNETKLGVGLSDKLDNEASKPVANEE